MKTIEVVAAILKKEDKILIAQRNKGQFDGMFEFLGGKIEENETHEETLKREMMEEIEIEIEGLEFFMKVNYQYPDFRLLMNCYECSIKQGDIKLHDHRSVEWIDPYKENIPWVPADVEVIMEIRKRLK